MKLQLIRNPQATATNGTLYINNRSYCYTIELPWKNNERNVSCIPTGKYKLTRRYSKKHGTHLQVKDVPNRSLILIHPANNALQELRGCIALVKQLTGDGTGTQSRDICKEVFTRVFEAMDNGEEVSLDVASS